ncbi:hypothetical protein MCANPG14_01053 [Mycoplasmopsis canis PG 14]|uniref:Uncharacterized protein conserved in bacteria n=2 Tax=Mycoplasmopsis canis TaxID=29555 RepID=A0A449AQV6_9BACT|nr:DUF2130 domain-containing protein [Mycoplasmopsis canis]AMD81304.1 hypothetical protein AXW82_01930 [Mycoplasmopsis canis PG 14]EIE40553.1 hypothetical protein MCANPG14_01053 [Mycoplasmopsis canis PG 14]VEU68722.1 Uncharacterized protein conserved in bacteria [Mycoplasmopsis canis]
MKKILIKIKNLDEMEFELLENAQPGDFISLKEILDAGSKEITSYISKASNIISRAKEEEIYNRAQEHFSKKVTESKEYNDLIIKFESEKNKLLEKHQSLLKEEIEKNTKLLSTKFNTDLNEALRKERELIATQKELEFKDIQNKIKIQAELLSRKDKEFDEKVSLLKKENDENQKIFNLNKQLEMQEEISKFKTEINIWKAQVSNHKQEKEMALLSLRKELEDKINMLNANSLYKDEKIKFLEEEKNNKDNIINDKVAEINKLNGQLIEARSKSSWKNNNIKTIGNEFEDHLLNMLEDAFSMDTSIRFNKATQAINGRMPDIVIEFLDKKNEDNVIGKLVIEAKAKLTEDGSKKNEEFYDKLAKDVKNYGANFGILVTELNPDESIFINFARNYNNIFVVRDVTFISLVKMLRMLFEKETEISYKEMNFKQKERIIKEFEEFFDKNIRENFERLQERLSDISKFADTIKLESEKIKDKIRNIEENTIKKIDKAFQEKFYKQSFLLDVNQVAQNQIGNIKDISEEVTEE